MKLSVSIILLHKVSRKQNHFCYNNKNIIKVNFGRNAVSGDVTVKGTNSCGDGAPISFPVTVNPLPSATGKINGPDGVCLGQSNVTYTVPGLINTNTVIWTLPAGFSG